MTFHGKAAIVTGTSVEREIREAGGEAACLAPDLRAPAPPQLVDFAIAPYGRIDIVVNNAGATKRGCRSASPCWPNLATCPSRTPSARSSRPSRSRESASLKTSPISFMVSAQGRFLHGALVDMDGGATKTI